MFGAALEGLVHQLEGEQGVTVQRPGHQRRQQPAELLVLDQPGSAVAEPLDGESVLAVEDAGREQAAEPAQPPAGVDEGEPPGGLTVTPRRWR